MENNIQQSKKEATAEIIINGGRCVLVVVGDWSINNKHTLSSDVLSQIPQNVSSFSFDVSQLGRYDSSLISLILRICTFLQEKEVLVDFNTLPEGIASMLDLAMAVPSAKTKKTLEDENFVNKVGTHTINFLSNLKNYVTFFGDVSIAFVKMLIGKARFRRIDLLSIIQKSGPEALPIVALISFLVGLILAFVGSIQLAKYGSEIFVADLVGIAMVREMGAMMVGIVMSGRTGASFAAELGAMKVNEEISAFRTFGISPIEFLVMPRIIALVCMFPLLTIFADVIGMLGG
ncbi:MAG: ABC transporter permease, partial [Opitutales bacterium]|nr:ABC transporter permease [Opitutales bacterium]